MRKLEFVDSHCHLYFPQFKEDRDAAVQRATSSGVSRMLVVGVEFKTFQVMMDLVERHPSMYATVGVHPSYRLQHVLSPSEFVEYYQKWILKYPGKIVGIGEMGLDYCRNYDAGYQRVLFKNQVLAAVELKLPIIVHTRNARKDTIDVLKECRADRVGGVIHCFSEDWEFAQQVIDLGFMLSFSGVITMPGHEDTLEAVLNVPDSRYLIETDSPFLTPHPRNNRKRNESAFVVEVAQKVADVKGVALSKVAEDSTDNFNRMFGLS